MQFLLDALTYFFSPVPSSNFKYMNAMIVVVVITLVISIMLRIYLKKQREEKIFRKYFRSLPGKLETFAIAEALYLLARYEHMPYISMRAVNYLIFAYVIYTLFQAGQTYFKVYPSAKKHHDHQLKMNQYLPRKKK